MAMSRERMSNSDHVLICVAWPYANGPPHLGHVAGVTFHLTFSTATSVRRGERS